ncbi:MAG: UDP-N-acetylglucosamine--N-acetylmuramyl-(pentapeptide) pyrophosphoryl-undecaprenol N-acetylglucosamine transferase [Candidatus Marinarcus sp.]|uniref:UDP-N-acetylglucosamine--N-acetylmuramyl- (pentapeptide) pyrophosphoryl-undecaprenol N-acetylglucosamine transferase n=1 Tax=Candidatus Marinarcus sp. TaxID=3100987 RepID=UPI003B00731B
MDNIVITGGGTGGHLKVAEAFINELHKRSYSPIYIGSKNGQDKQWFANNRKIKKAFFLDSASVVNKDLWGKVKSLYKIMQLAFHCKDIFEKTKITKVISVGGYSAAPATFASIMTSGCQLYIHEQNSIMGKLNQVTSRFATEVFSSYDPLSKSKDYPVDIKFFDEARVRREVKTVIFLGGSQGAKSINNFALKVAPKLNAMGIQIIHQTGKEDLQRVSAKYANMKIDVDVFDFTHEIEKKISKADFAISRSGASTLWELAANSLPTLFIPFPYAFEDHQYYNAKVLADNGMAYLKREDEITEAFFFECIKSDINKMSKALIESIKSDSIETIVDIILNES